MIEEKKDLTTKEINFTEEEAMIAAENVKDILKLIDSFKPQKRKMIDKFYNMLDTYNKTENSYRKKQLAFKLLELSKKIGPNMKWDSTKNGTYRKKEISSDLNE